MRPPPLQYHGQPGRTQGQGGERVNGGRAGAAVKGHAEAEGRLGAVQARPQAPVDIQHYGQFLGLGPTDPMGDQKGADLGRRGLFVQHQFHRMAGLLPAQPPAGVLATAHLLQIVLETLPARQKLGSRGMAVQSGLRRGVGQGAGRERHLGLRGGGSVGRTNCMVENSMLSPVIVQRAPHRTKARTEKKYQPTRKTS